MTRIVPISRERHSGMGWLPPASYAFASGLTTMPLVAAEVAKAALAMPLAFVRHGERFVLSALLGLDSSSSVFVGGDGKWLGRYVPSLLRAYPFNLAAATDGQMVLCVDEESGLVVDEQVGKAFFSGAGEPAEGLSQMLGFLQQVETSRAQLVAVCAALARHQLICPWPITVTTAEGERRLDGLFQVDERALMELPDDTFLELRGCGALPIAYAQLLSMHQLPLLGELAQARAVPQRQPSRLSGFALQDDGLLQFDWGRNA